jgi:hypothetical protein
VTSQGYATGSYHFIVYLEDYLVSASKVASVGNSNVDGYVLPGVNHRGRYGQAAGSKSSRVGVSDNSEFGEVTYWCADSVVLCVYGEGTFEFAPVGTIPVGDDQIFFGHSFRYTKRVTIFKEDVYWWVKCGSVWPEVINCTDKTAILRRIRGLARLGY